MNRSFLLTLAMLSFLVSPKAMAQAHKGISFQGVIKLPSGEYPTRAGLTVTARILSPNDCILREERFSGVNLSNGYINLAIGTGVASGYDPGFSMKKIMDNSASIANLTCLHADGSVNNLVTNFDPTMTSGARKLRVSLVIDSTPVDADFNMRSMAFAVNAESLDGKTKSDFIQASGSLTQARLEDFISAITSASGSSVMWNGSSFVTYDPVASNSIPDSAIGGLSYSKLTSVPTPVSEIGALSCANGEILKKVSGQWACAYESGVGLESDPTVQTFAKNAPGAGLEVAGSNLQVKMNDVRLNATGTWGIHITGNAATATTATSFSGSLVGDVTGTQGVTKVEKLQGNAVASGVPADGLLTWNTTLTRWEAVNPPTCSGAQVLVWSSASDSFSCQSISITKSQVSDFPTLGSLAGKSSVDLSTTEATGTLAAGRMPALSGDVTSTVGTTTTSISNLARTKLALGTANHVVINSGTGALSSEAQLAISRGGTGAATKATAFNALSPNTTKGDIIYFDGANNVRLPAGTKDQTLIMDSTGVPKWDTRFIRPTNLAVTQTITGGAAFSVSWTGGVGNGNCLLQYSGDNGTTWTNFGATTYNCDADVTASLNVMTTLGASFLGHAWTSIPLRLVAASAGSAVEDVVIAKFPSGLACAGYEPSQASLAAANAVDADCNGVFNNYILASFNVSCGKAAPLTFGVTLPATGTCGVAEGYVRSWTGVPWNSYNWDIGAVVVRGYSNSTCTTYVGDFSIYRTLQSGVDTLPANVPSAGFIAGSPWGGGGLLTLSGTACVSLGAACAPCYYKQPGMTAWASGGGAGYSGSMNAYW
ncbi:hypothetical protein [Bdellovibrio sp.]|uniref:hypothetical protein n=1 Tax=Bdellovibrio sp. TaxID=28201 RepID=UPI0039E4F3FD